MATLRSLHNSALSATLADTSSGGPRQPAAATGRYARREEFLLGRPNGSHMPIDTSVHWHWSNPLNLLVAAVLLAVLIAVVGMLIG